MRITGVQVQLEGAETVVQVTCRLHAAEGMEESDVQRVLDVAREAGGDVRVSGGSVRGVGDAGVSRDTEDADDGDTNVHDENGEPVAERGIRRRRGSASPAPVNEEDGEAARPSRRAGTNSETSSPSRRRRGAQPAEADPESDAGTGSRASRRRGSAAATEDNAGTASNSSPTADAGRPIRRRGGSASTAAETSGTEDTTTASRSEGGRRRRGAADPSSPSSASSAAENPSPSRGRRTSGGSAGGAESTRDSAKISDEELMKAASLTSRKCGGPEKVKAVLKEFAVGSLEKLPQADRQDFLDALAEARAAAEVVEDEPEAEAPAPSRRRRR